MSAVGGGGFTGSDALLAFAAIQQGRMNEEMTSSMKDADLRSQMASDLADIKAHLEVANRYPEKFGELDKELQAFMNEYGDEPALADVTQTVGEIADNIHERWTNEAKPAPAALVATFDDVGISQDLVKDAGALADSPLTIGAYADATVKTWLDQISDKLSSSGTNDQLAMIHIKQLNDNINNSSGMVSGIIESRSNATSSIINNIA
jgi:hypothetical protein